MSRLNSAMAALLLLAGCASSSVDSQLAQRIQRVEHGLVEFVPGRSDSLHAAQRMSLVERMAAHKIPGVGIAVIRGDAIEWAKGYGVLEAGTSAPVTTQSIFQAASTTKMLVASVVLHYVGEGRLDLDRDVNTYLMSWKIPENDLTRQRNVTLRLLLTHQSGLPMTDFPSDPGRSPSLVEVLSGAPPARNKPAVVESLPGSRWQYSNIGYVVIQQLLEDLTRKPLPRLMQEVVFEPLGMESSTLVHPLEPAMQKHEIHPHDAEGRAGELALSETAVAQGGLLTTPSDLARFVIEIMRAYRGESDRLLTRAMAQAMLGPEVELDPALLGMPLREGLGVMLSPQGEPFWFGHPGANYPGATCWAAGYPDLGAGIVVMTNGAKGDLLALELLPAFADEYVRDGTR